MLPNIGSSDSAGSIMTLNRGTMTLPDEAYFKGDIIIYIEVINFNLGSYLVDAQMLM